MVRTLLPTHALASAPTPERVTSFSETVETGAPSCAEGSEFTSVCQKKSVKLLLSNPALT